MGNLAEISVDVGEGLDVVRIVVGGQIEGVGLGLENWIGIGRSAIGQVAETGGWRCGGEREGGDDGGDIDGRSRNNIP